MGVYEIKCNVCNRLSDLIGSWQSLFGEGPARCSHCGGTNTFQYFGNCTVNFNPPMKPFFDYGSAREITSRSQIKEIEKSEEKVFGDHQELIQEAKKNKSREHARQVEHITNGIMSAIEPVLKREQ